MTSFIQWWHYNTQTQKYILKTDQSSEKLRALGKTCYYYTELTEVSTPRDTQSQQNGNVDKQHVNKRQTRIYEGVGDRSG